MKIVLACDHAGFELKEDVKLWLMNSGSEIKDFGAVTYEELDDYPDYIRPAAEFVSSTEGSLGIIFGGSGQGEAITANRVTGVRAAVYNSNNLELITLAREHNDANILSIGARFLSPDEVKEAIKLFLETKFTNEKRHLRRINKIDKI